MTDEEMIKWAAEVAAARYPLPHDQPYERAFRWGMSTFLVLFFASALGAYIPTYVIFGLPVAIAAIGYWEIARLRRQHFEFQALMLRNKRQTKVDRHSD